MSGVAKGLDFTAAIARLNLDGDDLLDTHAVRELLQMGEAYGLKAMADHQADKEEES